MTTPATPEQAREAADLYRATGTPVSATTVYSLAEQVEALTKERDALKSSELGLNRYAAKVNSENTALTKERDALKDAARLALDALEQLHTIDTETEIVTIWVEDEIAALKAVL